MDSFDHGGLGWMDVDCVWIAKDPSEVPEGREGALSFLSSNPYNIGVYWLLLTFWGPPEVPEGPEGTSNFKLKPLQCGCLQIPFDLRVDGKNASQIYEKSFL